MKQNLAVFDFEISQEDMKKIEKLVAEKPCLGGIERKGSGNE